ncbi:RHS repeat-associated core domain-containing protein [Mesonia aestuariivivens]|uniref:RHS repeat-associated core domain-containing protein n=1 Tax=Mesonia aestuariivivens TaxID=2796128 RepID=A0ABS6W2M7_9FLAO|nr:RHS repeat-associated core domain-containing protein [Mesonia aestuariivivens]MBW2962112.1 RHS repeat-associated core domain-containing protein [Mesonia aestuariivivens]
MFVEEHKNSNNSPYKFNGKELDEETGNYYYGARYYDPKWSVWLSVDPMAEKYPGWSPYNYTLQNPVKFVDPDGNAVWKPDSKGNLIAEKGDTVETLAKYLNQTSEKVGSSYNYNGKNIGTNFEFSEGDKVIVDNNMTRSIKNSNGKTPTGPDSNNPITPSKDNYICDQASQMAVDEVEINPKNAMNYRQFMPESTTKGFTEVENFDNVDFGKGIAIIGGQHVVTNYGQSKDGTQYVYSKDGRFYKPQVRTLQETIDIYNENQTTNFTMDDVKYYKQD